MNQDEKQKNKQTKKGQGKNKAAFCWKSRLSSAGLRCLPDVRVQMLPLAIVTPERKVEGAVEVHHHALVVVTVGHAVRVAARDILEVVDAWRYLQLELLDDDFILDNAKRASWGDRSKLLESLASEVIQRKIREGN